MSLTNYKNYGFYAQALQQNSEIQVNVKKDISINNINDHIDNITNILKDGIETDFIKKSKVNLSWGKNKSCRLSIIDYWYNLFMWYMVLSTGQDIRPKHIFWTAELKKNNIKEYIDKYILSTENKINIDNKILNSIICDGLCNFSLIEQFSYYLANTINNEDDIALMNANQEFYDLFHCSLQGVPLEDVKDKGMEITNRAIDIIKDSEKYIGYEHGLTNSFRASEAINARQFKEASFNIGTKSNGDGGIVPYIIDKSFKNGGVNDPTSYFIESSNARIAQILSKINVGTSGDFARLLGNNSTDTILNKNVDYSCMSMHFIKFNIKTEEHLNRIRNRYYRNTPNGIDYLIDDNDKSLVGKTIYLHSPITCSSNSSGHGICKKCYGNLYYTNKNINIGKLAAEILSAQLTQRLLSAKHLLETKVNKIKWNPEFMDYFNIDVNIIRLNDIVDDDTLLKKYTLIIDPDNVCIDNEDEDEYMDTTYYEYITNFIIRTPNGDEITFGSEDQDGLYLSNEMNEIIRKKAYNTNDMINVPLNAIKDIECFYILLNNNEISKTMNDIKDVINKGAITSSLSKSEALQRLVDLVIEGGIVIDSIHLEIILSNQIVNPDNIIEKPNWNDVNAKYKMLTLNQALTNNPSIIVSLLYKDLNKTLYNPLSYAKNKPSFFDLFFMEQPQNYISDELLVDEDNLDIKDPDKKIVLVTKVEKQTD